MSIITFYLLVASAVWSIATAVVADRRGHGAGAVLVFALLGAVLWIFGLLLALASSSSSSDGGGGSFRLQR